MSFIQHQVHQGFEIKACKLIKMEFKSALKCLLSVVLSRYY